LEDLNLEALGLVDYGRPFSTKLLNLAKGILFVDPATTTIKKHDHVGRYCPSIRDYESAHGFVHDGRGKTCFAYPEQHQNSVSDVAPYRKQVLLIDVGEDIYMMTTIYPV